MRPFCPSLIDPACVINQVVGSVAGSAAGGVLAGIAHAIQAGIAWLVTSTISWWVKIPSPNLSAEPAVGALQQWLMPITLAVAVLAMLVAAAKMALTRKANPLADVASGLALIAVTSALGVLVPSMLLRAGDAWSSWVLTNSAGGHFAERLTKLLTLYGAAPGVVVVLGMVAIVMSAIQAILMLFRQAALVVLAGVLPLAAAGTLASATRAWFRRVTGWMLALIFYKPAAAAVYATAFTMIGRGHNPRTILMGFAMVLLSLVALPALVKFFTWTTGTIDGPASGGFLGTMVSGAVAVGALRASPAGSSAADQARVMAAQLGPPSGPGPGGGVSPSGAGPRPGPGPSPSAAGSSGSGAAAVSPGPARPVQAGANPAGGTPASTAPTGAAAQAGASSGVAAGGAGTAAGGASAGAAAGSGAAATAGTAAGAAGGPVGMAVAAAASGAASTAASAARQATGAMQAEQDGE